MNIVQVIGAIALATVVIPSGETLAMLTEQESSSHTIRELVYVWSGYGRRVSIQWTKTVSGRCAIKTLSQVDGRVVYQLKAIISPGDVKRIDDGLYARCYVPYYIPEEKTGRGLIHILPYHWWRVE